MTAARSALWGPAAERLRYRPATPPPGATDRGRQDRLPVIHQLRQDGVSWPAQALVA
jgi:hypothetical protein